MSTENHINYVELPGKDLGQIKRFYTDVFSWTFTDYGPEYVAFSNAGLDGGFFKSDLSATTQTGSALVVLYSNELEVVRARVIEHGGTLSQDIFSFPGGRRFQFFDPSGNELAVWTTIE
jgi:predicted enzyme related to lactoylglutathione lyase